MRNCSQGGWQMCDKLTTLGLDVPDRKYFDAYISPLVKAWESRSEDIPVISQWPLVVSHCSSGDPDLIGIMSLSILDAQEKACSLLNPFQDLSPVMVTYSCNLCYGPFPEPCALSCSPHTFWCLQLCNVETTTGLKAYSHQKRIDEFIHELNQCTVPCGSVHI